MKWIVGSVAFLGLVLWASRGKANSVADPATPEKQLPQGTILITDHDKVWDYKLENGRWYTRKKPQPNIRVDGQWIDMKNNLSDFNYTNAVKLLTDHLNRLK